MTHNLIITLPDQDPVLYELNADRIGIGRSAENQIRIEVETISSSHAELRRDGDGFVIVDLQSKNGVIVNGLPLEAGDPVALDDGDRMLIGETVPAYFVSLEAGEEPEEAATKGSDADQQAAASYVTLGDKIHQLGRQLERMRESFESKQKEYQDLKTNIDEINAEMLQKTADGADKEELGELEKDLMNKTRRVSILKSDIDSAGKEIADLEKTAKTQLRAPAAPPSAAPPTPPTAPPMAPPAPAPSSTAPPRPPVSPAPGGPVSPPAKKFPTKMPGTPLPTSGPKKPPAPGGPKKP